MYKTGIEIRFFFFSSFCFFSYIRKTAKIILNKKHFKGDGKFDKEKGVDRILSFGDCSRICDYQDNKFFEHQYNDNGAASSE